LFSTLSKRSLFVKRYNNAINRINNVIKEDFAQLAIKPADSEKYKDKKLIPIQVLFSVIKFPDNLEPEKNQARRAEIGNIH